MTNDSVRVPRFLDVEVDLLQGRSAGNRPHLHIDEVDCNGTALDIVRGRPLYRTKLLKKVKRQILEMEELRAFAESKGDKAISADDLKKLLES